MVDVCANKGLSATRTCSARSTGRELSSLPTGCVTLQPCGDLETSRLLGASKALAAVTRCFAFLPATCRRNFKIDPPRRITQKTKTAPPAPAASVLIFSQRLCELCVKRFLCFLPDKLHYNAVSDATFIP
jgi:hypothetical protein